MAKRFTETNKWTNNKWFFDLSIESKLFWIYLLDSCDTVGVWEENILLTNKIIGYEYSMDTLLKDFKKQIFIFADNRKWWIKDFCDFQYGELNEDSTSKPIQSYISLLKKHTLWILYQKGIHTLQDKEKEKDKDKVKDKDKKGESEGEKKESLHFKMRAEFEQHFFNEKKIEYYWEAKDAGALKSIITKLRKVTSEQGEIFDDNKILEAWQVILKNIHDKWINNNLSVTLINSKYNQIIAAIKNYNPQSNDLKDFAAETIKKMMNGQP